MGKLLRLAALLALCACDHRAPVVVLDAGAASPPRMGAMVTTNWSGDLDGSTYSSQVVTGIEGHGVAAPSSSGALYWNGTAWTYNNSLGITQLTGDVIAGPGSGSLSDTVQSITPSGGTSTELPFNASGLKCAVSPFNIQDSGGVTRASVETVHGRATFGGGGSDVAMIVGPLTGSETTTGQVLGSSLATTVDVGSNKAGAILNLEVDAAAPWLTGAGGTQNGVALGPAVAGMGHGRVPAGWGLYKRNSSNTGDVGLITADGSGDSIYLGSDSNLAHTTNVMYATVGPAGYFDIVSSAASYFVFDPNGALGFAGLNLYNQSLSYKIGQNAAAASTNGVALTIQGQSAATSGFSGGNLVLKGGVSGGGAGVDGAVQIGSSDSANSITGSLTVTTRTITGNLTVDTTTTDHTVIADTSSGPITVTLPAPTNGRELVLVDKKNTFGTNALTLARHGSEKINGFAGSLVYSASGTRATITSDGTDWYTY